MEHLDDLYRKWYGSLTARIDERSQDIVALGGKEWFLFMRGFYGDILEAVDRGLLGGAVIQAEAQP